jgi:Putative Actinobacterial Holin-X, holin superfamily III
MNVQDATEDDMENKSIGGALVDVFDAAVSLVKTEITLLSRRVGNIAKAKGLGVVLLLAALVPLTLASVFLILFVFYGLMRLGLAAWSAALIMGLVSLVVTAALIFLGLKKLGAEVPDDDSGSGKKPAKLSDIAKDDLKYGAAAYSTPGVTAPGATEQVGEGQEKGTGRPAPVKPTGAVNEPGHTTGGHPARPVERGPSGQLLPVTQDDGQAQLHTGAAATSAQQPASSSGASGHTAAPQSTSTEGKPTTEAEQKGIPVSTRPTYYDDMKKEGY